MQIKLKSLHIENFKGIKLLDVDFGSRTKIKGQNASGKTTVFDAFTWLLFNKNSAGEEKFNVRPLDAGGNRIDNVEIKVAGILEVDGKDVELSKVQKQNWVKKRGTNQAVLQGNVNSFEIDGYPKSEADYKAYISGLVGEELFKTLTNPQYFSGKPWKDQRDILMKFVSDISDVELAKELNIVDGEDTHQYDTLIPELEKAPSTDDIRNKFSKALSEWKKKQAEIPVRIDELSKSLEDIDVAEQELAKAELERRIAEIDEKIADSGKATDALISESMDLQFAINGMYQAEHDRLLKERRDIENECAKAETALMTVRANVERTEKKIKDNKLEIEQAQVKRSNLGDTYKAESARVFDETPYLFHELEWQFDESSTICKTCGQALPADRISEIKADFEVRKAKAKADAAARLEEARTRFENTHKATLEEIKAKGFEQKHLIEELAAENERLEAELKGFEQSISDAEKTLAELKDKLSAVSKEPDMSGNAEYQQKKARYDELSVQIASLKESGSADDAFREERKALVTELDAAKADIAKVAKNVEIEERIGELETEQREVGQKVADQEQMLYLLESFIREKMKKISESINSKFNTVSWKLFDMQLNGGMKECCECTVNGVPYSTLNSGHRIIAGLDIIQSLSELYGVTAPIFTDNSESVNSFNIPEMKSQMIFLEVSEDKELVVKNIE
jgi:hypothetical protein